MFICDSCDDETYPEFCEEGEDCLPCGHTINLIDLKINGESFPREWFDKNPLPRVTDSGLLLVRSF